MYIIQTGVIGSQPMAVDYSYPPTYNLPTHPPIDPVNHLAEPIPFYSLNGPLYGFFAPNYNAWG